MFFKRFIVLAGGVLLFILAFIIYFDVSHAQMESRFQAEREKFHVQDVILTTADPGTSTPSPIPFIAPSAASPPASAAPSDTNTPIAPVPAAPDSSSAPSTNAPAPDSSSAPSTNAPTPTPAPPTNAPAPTPDQNTAPLPAPPSTWNEPHTSPSPFFVRTSYRPSEGPEVQFADTLAPAPIAPAPPPAVNPATNAVSPVTATSAPPAATNAAPASPPAVSEGAHPTAMEGSVIVLLYHQFKPAGVPIPAKFQWTLNQDVFAAEMKYIHDNGYHVVSLADVLRFLKHEITLPPASVCITIDDGYKSAIVYAAPILKQYGYPWTFFIYPDFITVNEGSGAASWKDLLDLQAQGVDIESHSMTHPNLKLHHQLVKGVWHNFTPAEYDQWLTNETAGSKALLEQKMGKPITCFAYPYGEYNTQVEASAIAAGYEAILTVAGNPVHSTTDPRSIGRYTITQSEVKYFASDLRQGALGLGQAEPAPGSTITNPRPVISAVLGYPGAIDPNSIETSVYDFDVRHDFDPKTNVVRLYLPRDLIKEMVPVNIRVKDAKSGQVMVARWRFNYEPPAGATTAPHPPIAPATNSPSTSKPVASAATNAPAAAPEPLAKSNPVPSLETSKGTPH